MIPNPNPTQEIDMSAHVNELADLLIKTGAAFDRTRAFTFLSMRTRPHIRDGIMSALFPS